MEDLISQLNDIKSVWSSSEAIPSDLSDWGIPLLNKEKVAYTLDECLQLLFKVRDLDWQGPVVLAIHQASLYLSEMSNYITTRLKQPKPQQDFSAFIVQLNQLLITLRNAAAFSSDKVYNSERELLRVTSQIETSRNVFQTLTKMHEDISAIKAHVETSLNKIIASEKTIVETQEKLTTASATVTPLEPQIKEMHAKAEQLVNQIAKHKDDITSLRGQYEELHSKTGEEASSLEHLQNKCQKQQEEIQKTIEDASRLGMAGSFRLRKIELERPMMIWGVSFFVGVSILTLIAFFNILPLLKSNHIDWFALFGRLPLLAPAIWFSWFSVKQFSYTTRLWEDYAFKYASAMAFEGYKKEAVNISPEMLKLLMEISIVNFSSNPLRVYDSKNIHSSPLNELTDDSKGLLQQSLEIIKGITTKDKK